MRCIGTLKAAVVVIVFATLGPALHATTVSIYQVSLNTAPLVGHPAGPFYLEVALTDGSGVGDANNTVTISDIDFGGGGALGSPLVFGGAIGSLETGITITDSSFLSLFIEQFAPGGQIRFTLGLTSNDDAGGTPDRVVFFVVDGSGNALPTLAPFGDYFFAADLRSTGPVFDAYSSDTNRAPTVGPPVSIAAPTIQFLPRQTKVSGLAALMSLPSTGDKTVDRELNEAIRHVKASLAPSLWADDLHLTDHGKRVFEEEQRAVQELTKLKHVSASLLGQFTDAVRTFTRVNRALAQTALDQAQLTGGEADDLAQAQKDLTRGDKLADRGEFEDAIERYEDAWVQVQKAIHGDDKYHEGQRGRD